MQEEKIIITINEDGSMEVKSEGIKGEACINEIESLLQDIAQIKSGKKTDEYYQKVLTKNTITLNKKH